MCKYLCHCDRSVMFDEVELNRTDHERKSHLPIDLNGFVIKSLEKSSDFGS